MMNNDQIVEFGIEELEDRVEFGVCGGGSDGGDGEIGDCKLSETAECHVF